MPTAPSPKHQARPQAAGEAWTRHIHMPPEAGAVQGTTEQGRCALGGGIARRTRPRVHTRRQSEGARGATQTASLLPSAACHRHARQRMGGSLVSRWVEASGAASAPYVSPAPCFPSHHLHHPFRLYASLGQRFFPLHWYQAQPSGALTPKAAVIPVAC